MKKLFVLLTICLGSVACKDITADFTYSPEQPKAGETITFTNTSNGDKWSWDFGDATTSTSKNPTKTFKKSGVYTVRLKVNGKSSATKTKQIT
ncbi:MAG: PKD domain-containing protein, partial [Paludibacteraceae bacterium]|nr:PKD domain-containing protein [Paludibacteraceae bacterium]